MFLNIFLLFLCVFLILCCAFWAYLLVFVVIYKVPLISTHKAVVEKMVFLADIQENQKVYDLGCGFAPMLFLAAKNQPNSHYFGIDVLRPILWFDRLKAKILGRNIEFIKSDFFKLNLRDSDVIFCYLWDTIMAQIYTDIWPNLKSGARLISHDFPIKKLTPFKVEKVGKSTIYFYIKD